MKKIFESPLNGWDESAEKIHVYALENDDEYWELSEMRVDERCNYFGVQEESWVAPGAMYHRYEFEVTLNYVIMIERIAYNV